MPCSTTAHGCGGTPPAGEGSPKFWVDGHRGHTFADTFEPGHWSVWGEPEGLRSTVSQVYPIDE